MSSAGGEEPKKAPRRRPPKPRTEPLRRGKACLNCRHLKIRCDGARPVCGPCVRVPKDDQCEYTDVSSRTKELQTTIARLKARVNELENPGSTPPIILVQSELAGPSESLVGGNYEGSSSMLPPSPSAASSGFSDVSGLSREGGSESSLLGVQEPPFEMMQMLLDAFLPHGVQFGFFMHTGRFRTAALLQLPLGHPARPSPAVLCAVYLWGIHLSRSEPMVSYEAVFIRRAQQHISTELSDTVHSVHRVHTIQAHILLSTYFLRNKQFLEAEFHTNGAVTLALGYHLHKIRSSRAPSPPFLGSSTFRPENLLGPPQDAVEEGERIRAFWTIVCHQNNLLMTVHMPGDNFGILDSPGMNIDTPWPLELTEYELGLMPADLRGSDTVEGFVSHGIPGPGSLVALQVQASVLLQRAVQLSRTWSPGMQPQAAAAHASASIWLEARVQQLSTQLPAIDAFHSQIDEARILLVAQGLLDAALIQIHKSSTSHSSATVTAARRIVTTFGDAIDNIPDVLCAGPVVGTLLLLACQVILREIERTRYFRASLGTTLDVDMAYSQEEAVLLVDLQNGLTTMTLFSLDSPLGQYQLSKVQQKCDALGL
ncbi:hypothetical protein C8F01DRAFT_1121092 [Mycena amicta]|nr:hypothetical protein C8F01DRAFT_1121092 [Mycena amicta]